MLTVNITRKKLDNTVTVNNKETGICHWIIPCRMNQVPPKANNSAEVSARLPRVQPIKLKTPE